MISLIRSLVLTGLTQAGVSSGVFQKAWSSISSFIFGDDGPVEDLIAAQGVMDRKIASIILHLPRGIDVLVTLYIRGTISSSVLANGLLIHRVQQSDIASFVPSAKLKKVFDDTSSTEYNHPHLKAETRAVIYNELKALGLV